jgi:menaquinone-specific isochorismate synthase
MAFHHLKEKLRSWFEQRQPAGIKEKRWERISLPLAPLDILSWLNAQDILPKIFWQARDSSFECAAAGKACECAGDPPQPYAATLSAAQNLIEHLPEGARLWGGMAFDPCYQDGSWKEYGPARFVLPRLEIAREGQRYFLALHVSREEDNLIKILNFLERLRCDYDLLCPDLLNSSDVLTMESSPAPDQWEGNLQRIQELISRKQIRKVVLARKTIFKKDFSAGPFSLVQRIRAAEIPSSHYFFVFQWTSDSAFVGVSPEQLFRRLKTRLTCEALAATARRGLNENQDRTLGSVLLNSVKERHEHQIVVEMITRALAPLCRDISFAPQPRLIRLNTGFHLMTPFQGTCSGFRSDHELISNLHPTAAVAGCPTEKAMRMIRDLEPFSRGWYAGPVGYWGAERTEFCVAIRSGLWQKECLTLFTGAGIVKGSVPASEWQELDHKLISYLKILDYEHI